MSGTFRVNPYGDFEIRIGSDPNCELQSSHLPTLAGILRRRKDRLFFRNYAKKTDVTVNGKNLRRSYWRAITPFDKILICGSPLNLSPAVFLGTDHADLDSSELYLSSKKKKLSNGVYIRAKKGTVTAVMGPSGAGKTVFLEMLNGYNPPSEGKILINKEFDLQEDYLSIRDFIGYVPQDEIMIPELTLRQSLDYRLRLRYPDTVSAVRKRLIEETCNNLGLQSALDTVIGSPESGLRGLSGGEKRRANIAHELVLQPLILILDEPTSGLSSVGAEQVVKLLHNLARQSSLTIIGTIHQPSRDAFYDFNDLLIISKGGKPAYYGKAKDAQSYFEITTAIQCGNDSPPEYIMRLFEESFRITEKVLEKLGNEGIPQSVIYQLERLKDQNYKNKDEFTDALKQTLETGYYLQHNGLILKHALIKEQEICDQRVSRFNLAIANSEFPSLYNVDPDLRSNNPSENKKKTPRRKWSFYQNFRQWLVLFQRNLHVLFKDWRNCLLLLGQVPVIALLIICAFNNFANDNQSLENFARRVYFVGYWKTQSQAHFPAHKHWRKSFDKDAKVANEKPISDFISEFGSRQRGVIYFVMVAASIWFGIMGSCKEIVTEQHILRRELRSCVNLLPYLFGKIAMLILLVGIQTAMLTGIIALFLLKLPLISAFILWCVLWMAAIAATTLGLCVSCISPTYRLALTFVPLIVVFQLIFGGLMRPLAKLDINTELPKYFAVLTFQRWGFEAALSADTFSKGDVLKQEIDDTPPSSIVIREFDIIKYTDSNILHSFFKGYNKISDENRVWKLFPESIKRFLSRFDIKDFFCSQKGKAFFIPMGCLMGYSLFFMGLSYGLLRWKFLR